MKKGRADMINSRQIVEIIKDEMNKEENNKEVRKALKKVKERIEILEEIDYVNTVKQPVHNEEYARQQSTAKQKATEEFKKFFNEI
tara:strand:+ start:1785 stop:2042 length:258 start_codon:yes stop_codon:yes gene_type:complete